MHDPMALLTNYLLAAFAFAFAALTPTRWRGAFFFTGIAALLGGTYHELFQHPILWKAVVFSVGIASFFLIFERLRVVAIVKLIVYLGWMAFHDEFIWVIADYSITLILIAIVYPAKKWIFASIGVSVLAALVQQAQLTIDPYWFDHNDLYHIIQIVALWLLYRAATATKRSATVPPTTQPTRTAY
jgi:hypothetical protein